MQKLKSAWTMGIAATVLVAAMACNTRALGQTAGTSPAVTQPPSQSIEHHQPSLETIQFSGYAWEVKASATPVGPGPNYFSDRAEDVWVDGDGRLHMTITYRDGKWYNTEISSVQAFGNGTFSFTLASRVDQLDENVVLGMFTWDETAQPQNYREMDIELSRWGNPTEANAQFVVQPGQRDGNRRRFDLQLQGPISTHRFVWSASAIRFSSFDGRMSMPDSGSPIDAWTYTGSGVPSVGPVHARINLWLYRGKPPADGQSVQVVVQAFEFIPLK
jgi:hypothetical protein